jgi:glycosyltransferase involved in cell wall biosynthesis
VRRVTLTYDAHNAEHVLQRRAFTTDLPEWRRAHRTTYSLIQWLRLRRFERDLCRASDHIIAVSNADRAALGRLAPGTEDRISVLPNGVDVDYWSLDALRGEPLPEMVDCSIVFDGSMDFRPNIDAVRWFGLEVWPMIYAGRKDARFYIVGRNPAPEVAALASRPGIIVTGAVKDTRPWVAGALVYVVPMRMGGGVRLKMLQAMSMERAIVSTTMGAEGVDVENGREVLLAIGPEAFARSVLTLTSDGARRRRLGAAARDLVAQRYRWPVILPGLEQIYPGGG